MNDEVARTRLYRDLPIVFGFLVILFGGLGGLRGWGNTRHQRAVLRGRLEMLTVPRPRYPKGKEKQV